MAHEEMISISEAKDVAAVAQKTESYQIEVESQY